MSSSGAVQTYEASNYAHDLLAVGEENYSRRFITTNGISLPTGTLRLSFFTSRKTETKNTIRSISGNTATNTPTLCRMGIYGVDGAGNLTLIAACASDVTIWASTSTPYSRALTTPWASVLGQRYAGGCLCVATAGPTLQGRFTGGGAAEAGLAPRLVQGLAGQVDLPATILAGAGFDDTNDAYMAFAP